MKWLLPLLLYQRAHITATRVTEYVVYMRNVWLIPKPLKKITCFEGSTQNKRSNIGFCMKFGLRSPVRRMEYLALEKIYALDLRVFATKIIRFVWNIPSILKKVCHTRFIVVYFFTDCFYLWYQSPSPTLWKNLLWLRIFTTFYALSIHFFIKSEAMFADILWWNSVPTASSWTETIKTLCSVMRKPSSDSWSMEQIK